MADAPRATLIPGDYSPRFTALFARYTRSLLRRRFHAVRLARGSEHCLTDHASDSPSGAPQIMLMNHSAWWDPLVGILLARQFQPHRRPLAPMDAAELERFELFRRLGVFGIDPADPGARDRVINHAAAALRADAPATLWITPQGRFADVRAPIQLRPGAAAIAARVHPCRVVCIAVEYAFWLDNRPEIFVRAARCDQPAAAPTTTSWHRAMHACMQGNAAALASLVIARDPAPFETLLGAGAATINPAVDLWLKLRGKAGPLAQPRGGAPA